jgi:hypothetical protein
LLLTSSPLKANDDPETLIPVGTANGGTSKRDLAGLRQSSIIGNRSSIGKIIFYIAQLAAPKEHPDIDTYAVGFRH